MITIPIAALLVILFLGIHKFIRFISPAGKTFISSHDVLIVTAHPDDECMFFSPTIFQLRKTGHEVHLLCLSSGNYNQKGDIRKKELQKSCAILGIPLKNVTVLDHSSLPDDPNFNWDPLIVADVVQQHIKEFSIGCVITFDGYGVSGHRNHIAVYHGVKSLFTKSQRRSKIEAYRLVSVNLLRKYSLLLDLPYSFYFDGQLMLSNWLDVHKAKKAMEAHASQYVWFRWLYVAFSRYMIMNTLKPLCGK
ncbi:N-acetylglucosaminyl-phosphatidylinositol de-N-acetylase [Lingula anatina]|uniref:N-acetylglucosaminylphosphatidylinositol deacetylase n=1 Tax=Lingula anatina TaxID=7574 RepID=A0A1S3K238_LINAN|nr:N-acetylglucosaminyl-phosphatidylinositol de-N-acetylase [Lingula anatina]|eukprot:XP_013416582.1 N-acetylglucosaminyl-phosphatidylinositol de-N-acetylase [Lingula anatina]